MGRPKNFDRAEVLKRAMPLFWERGFADTGLQDIEKATGLNKSSLYAEFKSKDEIFLEVLRHYLANRPERALLSVEPLGFHNIEKYMKVRQRATGNSVGCFSVNSMRDSKVLPSEAQVIMREGRVRLKALFAKNVAAEKTKLPVDDVVEIISTFFSGLQIEQNMKMSKSATLRKISNFIAVLRKI